MSKKISCLFTFLGGILNKAHNELDEFLDVAVNVVQLIKSLDDAIGDPLAAILGGFAPKIQAGIKAALPRILVELRFAQDLSQLSSTDIVNQAMRKLLRELKQGAIEPDAAYTKIAALILQQLYAGKLTYAEAVIDVETHYQTEKDHA